MTRQSRYGPRVKVLLYGHDVFIPTCSALPLVSARTGREKLMMGPLALALFSAQTGNVGPHNLITGRHDPLVARCPGGRVGAAHTLEPGGAGLTIATICPLVKVLLYSYDVSLVTCWALSSFSAKTGIS
jgi:hypothetical protein